MNMFMVKQTVVIITEFAVSFDAFKKKFLFTFVVTFCLKRLENTFSFVLAISLFLVFANMFS